jgi:hypothetical protein
LIIEKTKNLHVTGCNTGPVCQRKKNKKLKDKRRQKLKEKNVKTKSTATIHNKE